MTLAALDRLPPTLSRALLEEPSLLFALLFGSRATGTERGDSDWDIAVALDPALTPAERFAVRRRLASSHPRADIVLLDEAPTLLAHAAFKGERLLVRDPTALVRTFVRTLATSNDMRHFREVQSAYLRRRLEQGTYGRP